MVFKGFAGSLLAVVVSLCVAGSAWAVSPGPGWTIHSFASPTSFSAEHNAGCNPTTGSEFIGEDFVGCDAYEVTVTNVGSVAADGSAVAITDALPAGLAVLRVGLFWSGFGNGQFDLASVGLCSSSPVRCRFSTSEFGLPAIAPDETLRMIVIVGVEPGAPESLQNTVSVSGGGGGEASASALNTNGPVAPLFGVAAFDSLIAGLDGAPDTQAGDHPYEYSVRFDLNNVVRQAPVGATEDTSVHDVRDVMVDLPVGFVGSVLATPTCTQAQLSSEQHCPLDTAIGTIETRPTGATAVESPLWNIAPERGVAAELGFVDLLHGSHVLYAGVAPTPAGYVLRTTAPDTPQVALNDAVVHVFSNPAVRDGSGNTPIAFFTTPSDCSGEPLSSAIHMDSWQSPGRFNVDGTPDFSDPNWASGTAQVPPVTGCDLLRLAGSLTAQLETAAAATPSGLSVELKVPQSETPGTLGTPPLKKVVVAFPAGLSINPSAGGGLAACSMAQVGISPSGVPNSSRPSCPEASKIGTVEVETPAVAGVLAGSVYLASQNENPFHTLLAGYVVVDDPVTGVLIKVPGRIDPDPVTGQLVVTVDQIPQFPFSDLKLHVFGGPRASLSTPAACGSYTTSAQLTPWSAPDSGPPLDTSDSFQVTSGCPGGFSPSFTAGTVNNQAGGFSPFTATFSRTDEDQNLAGVTVTTPPGLLGILKGVERCPEPQASQGACPQGSLIGHTTVAAGTGPNPFWVQGSQVFLTGPYKGAPFGLSVVVPAVAGPFNLGTVVVRAAIHVDPHTAQITVVSDPLPTILDGIPLDVRTVNVAIDRPGFIFNPTSCEPLSVGGALTSTQGATANVSSRFQASNCANLPFHPVFTVSTQARTSKHNGASLTVKTTFPAGAQANIRSVAVVLPKQLPARLTTIQQACPEATFAANPASCPAGSDIGIGTATTPILTAPATGPAYLVSHGGAAFPDVDLVFQDEGVTLVLVGSVNIKHGITHSTFATVPDAPISSFQLTLPEGSHSGLTAVLPAKAKGSLCGTSLTMPFTITAQNGAQLKQNLKIAVTGCPKPKKKAKAKHNKAKRGG